MPLRLALVAAIQLMLTAFGAGTAFAVAPGHRSEIDLVMPDLSQVSFLGIDGHTLLLLGIGVCIAGLAFGLVIYGQLKNLPVHRSMLEISELIYETCKTYLITQGKFILLLWLFIGAIMVVYFGFLVGLAAYKVGTIILLQPGRHGRLLRGGLVRHPRQHLRQLPHRLRLAARQAVGLVRHPAPGRHVDRPVPDLARAGDDGDHPAVRPARSGRTRASSASPSANRWAPRRCASRAASSPRSPTSAPT